ncbi:acireductone synthase [Pseudomonas sp. KNUC1026]|uniref:acireductone synthase n=1 Tax=Pseudomonas sp. KNUC1026 TaxID=2893890 RepID=UPI001F36846B|nr:acireductone synthase [Pseudomonas sp. KNUC1026]UFH50864.1 acireductone synthase [Pseudomonas sp. KNUC1026]
MPITHVLTDIEGTTSSVSFVYEVLFPFAALHLPAWVRAHPDAPEVDAVRASSGEAQASTERVIEIVLGWMAEDRKATPLKAIQGHVWADGYETGRLHGHVYPDAVDTLSRWHAEGLVLAVYSSGSVQAQKLLFGYSEAGDLTALFSHYFDTGSGGKREAGSYLAIAQAMDVPAEQVLFLSDVVQELDAAQAAGMVTCGLVREGGELPGHVCVGSFSEIRPRQ